MVGIDGAFLALLSLGQPLTIFVQAKCQGQGEDLGGGEGFSGNPQGQDNPIVAPRTNLKGFTGTEGIVMHAGPEQGKSAFTAQRVVAPQQVKARGNEPSDQGLGQNARDLIEEPGGVTEEAMKAAPMVDAA